MWILAIIPTMFAAYATAGISISLVERDRRFALSRWAGPAQWAGAILHGGFWLCILVFEIAKAMENF